MPDVLQVLAEEIATLRKRIEFLEAQEDATNLSRLTINNTGALVIGRTNITLASDAITVINSYVTLDTEGGASSDNLATINGGVLGMLLILQTINTSHDVVVKHGTGNIFLNGKVDFTLTGTRDRLVLISNGSEWLEIGRGDNT